MRPQDPIYQRTRELLALQEQLVRQVDECRFEAGGSGGRSGFAHVQGGNGGLTSTGGGGGNGSSGVVVSGVAGAGSSSASSAATTAATSARMALLGIDVK